MNTFDISENGFLPETCIKDLPPGWKHLQPILDNLTKPNFRSFVDKLPSYSDEQYKWNYLKDNYLKFLYSILSMINHRYLWCNGEKNRVYILPKTIAKPWFDIAEYLGIAPSLTHAYVDMYN